MSKRAQRNARLTAVSRTFVKYDAFLKKFLTRFFSEHQDIEDVAQEAYLRAYVAEQRQEITQPKAYLFRIARNIALTELTRKSRQITSYIEDTDPSLVLESGEGESGVDTQLEALDSLGLYCEAVAALPEKCRIAFLLRKVYGLTHKEIASRMSLSVSSVEKYLARGILACRDLVNEREGNTTRANASSAENRRRSLQ